LLAKPAEVSLPVPQRQQAGSRGLSHEKGDRAGRERGRKSGTRVRIEEVGQTLHSTCLSLPPSFLPSLSPVLLPPNPPVFERAHRTDPLLLSSPLGLPPSPPPSLLHEAVSEDLRPLFPRSFLLRQGSGVGGGGRKGGLGLALARAEG